MIPIQEPGESPDALAEELAHARAERDAAVLALDKQGRRTRRRQKARRGFVGVLVVLFSILLPVTVALTWAHNIVLNNNGWERTVGPIASDPAVTAALGAEITNELYQSLQPQKQIEQALPPRASFLAGPIANGAKGYVQQGVTKVLNSHQFQTLWLQANSFAHAQLVNVLEGHSKAVTTTNGKVVLNLVPVLNSALAQVQGFVSGVVGKPVKLPTISGNEIPSKACQKIGAAIHRPIPSTCGQIPLFPAAKLTQAQRVVRAFNRLVILLLVLTPVVAILALWLSRRRRRTLLQLTVGGLLGMVVIRRAVIWLQNTLINTGKPQNRAAREAIMGHVLHVFFLVTLWLVIGLVVVLVLTLVTGPYSWARSLRTWISDGARETWRVAASLGTSVVGRARDERTIAWMRSHLDLLRVAGVVLGIILILLLSVSFIGFLVIAALVVLYELWLARIGAASGPAGEPASESASEEVTPPPRSGSPSATASR